MSGLVLLVAILAIAGVVVWSIRNDEVEIGGETRWLFAMRDGDDAATDKPGDTEAITTPDPDDRPRAAPGGRSGHESPSSGGASRDHQPKRIKPS